MAREEFQDIGNLETVQALDHVREGKILILCGPQRTGKTLGNVMFAHQSYAKGRKVFSTIKLGFPHEPIDFSEIQLEDGTSRFLNSYINIDEWNFFLDPRRSMSKENLRNMAFMLQAKKQGCIVGGTTHGLSYVDVRLRDNFDFLITPRVFPAYPKKPVAIRFTVETGPQHKYSKRVSPWIDCRKYLGMYDTRQTYDPFKKPAGKRERFSV